ncbi:MAG: HAD family phosphatase [Pirellulales bacterium]
MAIRFVYFDFGNVLFNFDHRRAARQMAAVAGVSEDRVWEVVFAGDLEHRYEAGQITSDEFYEQFCRATDTRPDRAKLMFAAGAIFELNTPIVPVVAQLQSAGHRTGVLSNTCECHWQYCVDGRFALLPGAFEQLVLSYEVRSMKPEAKIYDAAIEAAAVRSDEIFFIDDRQDNVDGALSAGIDAVLYESAGQCAAELKRRSLAFNY